MDVRDYQMMQTIKMEIRLFPRVEILMMASKLADSNALKTYLTNKLDKKHLILTFMAA